MTAESPDHTESDRDLVIIAGLLFIGAAMMYLGRAEFIHHASWLSGGFGGIVVTLGGGSAEQAQNVQQSVMRREPTLIEQVTFWIGVLVVLIDTAYIHGWFR